MRVSELEDIYPVCRSILGRDIWNRLIQSLDNSSAPEALVDIITSAAGDFFIPDFLPELSRLEWTQYAVSTAKVSFPKKVDSLEVNPTLEILHLSHRLLPLLKIKKDISFTKPEPSEEWVLVWRDFESGRTNVKAASNEELLAIKLTVEEIAPKEAAALGKISVDGIDALLSSAVKKGLLIAPRSRIGRRATGSVRNALAQDRYMTAYIFTLQWHITNACDLHCKHCYDRSRRSPLTLKQGFRILDDLVDFCKGKYVKGHVCFSGGNPFMSAHFTELYRAAVQRGFSTSILANPVSEEKLRKILEVKYPRYFQVSLEGLPEHNDFIRGEGSFKRVMEFLDLLRKLGVSSAVMLTLTNDNLNQVLPLAEMLREKADYFTFNRLSLVGEGAKLKLPTRREYEAFLDSYIETSKTNPIMGFKDNLINIGLKKRNMSLFGGCTGFGCGAAFNFIAVLPDGEAHACRKFPSPIGNVMKQSIASIYDSDIAEQYRRRPRVCQSCSLSIVCGGCLAIAYSHGQEIHQEKDPYCFILR